MAIIFNEADVQVVLNYSGELFASGNGATVLGWNTGTPLDAAQRTSFAAAIAAAWEDNVQAITSSRVTLDDVTLNSDTWVYVQPSGATGETADATCPPNVAILASYGTSLRSRRGHGRSYLPGLAYDSQILNNGTLEPAWRTDIDQAWGGFLSDLGAAVTEGQQVILQSDQGESAPFDPSPVVTSMVIGTKVATQRRRLRP